MQKIIAIVGPTASGKTALGIALARKLGGEIISADSRQVYRGMDLIAGTVSKKEAANITHHMLRIADPKRQSSAGEFANQAQKIIEETSARRHIPIVVGGTGFYIDALLSEKALPEVAPNKKLREKLQRRSAPQLLFQLRQLDLRRAQSIDPHNKVRLIRSIEIAKALGKVPEIKRAPRYKVLWLGLSPPSQHEAALTQRLMSRLRKGMLSEVKKLRSSISQRRFKELGMEFELLGEYARKQMGRKELVEKMVRWEITYAKRQMRWLKRNRHIHWVKNNKEALRLASSFLK